MGWVVNATPRPLYPRERPGTPYLPETPVIYIYIYICGGHRGLAHPRSQDSLLPIRHLLIITETDSRVKWLLESSVSVCDSECSKQAAGNIQCASGEVVFTCEYVLCVESYIPSTITAETTHTHTHTHTHTYIYIYIYIFIYLFI